MEARLCEGGAKGNSCAGRGIAAVRTDGDFGGTNDVDRTLAMDRFAIKVGQDEALATSTPHQPANAGFAPGLRLNVGECGVTVLVVSKACRLSCCIR